MASLSIPNFPFQVAALRFAETITNVATIQASHAIRFEANDHDLTHWDKIISPDFSIAKHQP